MDGTSAERSSLASANGTDAIEAVISSETAVKVAVLVRPLLPHEQTAQEADIVQLPGPSKITLPAKANGTGVADAATGTYNFDFDAVFRVANSKASRAMFGKLCMPVVERFCQGFNGAILAYGQTGSGKTYTMGTGTSLTAALQQQAQAAVVPALITVLFGYVHAARQQYQLLLKVQYVEIYNEAVQDLLAGFQPKGGSSSGVSVSVSGNSGRPDIRENTAGEVVVDGVTCVTISTPAELAEAVDFGTACRSTGAHKMNEQSSRSHAILTITMEQRALPVALSQLPPELHFLRSRLHLVDLAGSERVRDTAAQGARFAEGVSINKGLLELGNVINALAEGTKRRHVPYRNSKLTRVLQDSLGGSAETLMLACVSPAACNHDQTLNTLRYANRARAIRNKLTLNNKQSLDEEVVYLRELVARLTQENSHLREQLRKAK